MLAPPEFKEIHPLGKAPIISIESPNTSKPIVLAESGLIAEYLVEHFAPRLAPKQYAEGKEGQVGGETETWLRYRYYMHYAEGSLMPYLVVSLLLSGKFFIFSAEQGCLTIQFSDQKRFSLLHQTYFKYDYRRNRIKIPRAKLQNPIRFSGKSDRVIPRRR